MRKEYKDIVYKVVNGNEIKLDIYLPSLKESKKIPVIVFYHGGGWRKGSKDSIVFSKWFDVFEKLMDKGYAIVNADYRLSDGNTTFPAHVEDSKDVVRWIRKNAEGYGLDEDRVATMGGSSGAHLALMTMLTPDISFIGSPKLSDYSSRVSCVVSIFGPVDLSKMEYENSKRAVEFFLGGKYEEIPEVYKKASPITYLDKKVVPILLIHGTKDLVVPYSQAEIMYKKGKKLGTDIEFITVKEGKHGYDNFSEPKVNPSIDEIRDSIVSFIEKKL